MGLGERKKREKRKEEKRKAAAWGDGRDSDEGAVFVRAVREVFPEKCYWMESYMKPMERVFQSVKQRQGG